jgi:hypothetical protein
MVSLEQGEYIVREVRRHWFFVATRAVLYVILGFAPVIGYPALAVFFPSLFTVTTNSASIFFALYPLWLLLLWISFFLFWTNYYLDVLILTNERIIDIDQRSLFHRQVSEFRLENIQDITTDVPGFIATFLDFGDIHVQTAGEKREFIINDAARPEEVKRLIADEHDRVLEMHRHHGSNKTGV